MFRNFRGTELIGEVFGGRRVIKFENYFYFLYPERLLVLAHFNEDAKTNNNL